MLMRVLLAALLLIGFAGGWSWYSDRQLLESLQVELMSTRYARERFRAAAENNHQLVIQAQERLALVVAARDAAENRTKEIEARYVEASNKLEALRRSSPAVADWSDQPVPDDVADWLRDIHSSPAGSN